MDEKSRDHEVIIGESDNSESPISKEFKRKIFYSEPSENYKSEERHSVPPLLLDY